MAYVGKIYANTLASYNEKYLMDGDRLRRLIDSSYADALRLLQDYGWGEGAAGEITADTLLAAETAKLIAFVRENAVSARVRDVLLSEFLFHNAKAAYKGKVAGVDVARALYGGFDEAVRAVEDGDYALLPDVLADCLASLDELSQTKALTPREIEMAVTRARYAYALERSRGDRKLKKYVKSEIDLKNLLTLFRCRILGLDGAALAAMSIGGGSLDLSEMIKALDGSAEAFALFYARSDYADVFAGVEQGEEAVTELEANIDNYLYALTLAGRDDFLSDSPFVNYFHRALLELKTVKTVLVCLKNGVPEEIKRRLRAIYD